MDDVQDGELVGRVRAGDLEAFGDLVERYQSSAFGVCYRLMGERQSAEDMTQEAFLRAYDRLETFDVGRPFGPWVRQVAANLCLNELKRARLLTVPILDEVDSRSTAGSRGPEQAQLRRETRRSVRAALQELPAHYRAAIELRHIHEMSYREIGMAMGWSESEVKTNLYRARKELSEKIGESHDNLS